MRVNYQSLLNQTLGAVGSTASTLKFLHNQDPRVIEEKQQEVREKQQQEKEEAQKKQIQAEERNLSGQIDAKNKEIGKIQEQIAKDASYDRFDEPIINPKATYLSQDSLEHHYTEKKPTLENLYADIMQLSDARYNLNPTAANLKSSINAQNVGRTEQANLQDRAESDMMRSVIRKIITTQDQEESYKLRKKYLGGK